MAQFVAFTDIDGHVLRIDPDSIAYIRSHPVLGSGTTLIGLKNGEKYLSASSITALQTAFSMALPVSDGGGSLTVDGTVAVSGTTAVREAAPSNDWTWASVHSTTVSADTIYLDTDQLTAGEYDFDITISVWGPLTAGLGVLVEHRNDANNATRQIPIAVEQGGSIVYQLRNYAIGTNERLRVTNPVALTSSVRVIAAIGRRISNA